MRRLIGTLLCLTLLAGCEPSPPENLGTVLDEAPKIPGTEEPYKMPELDRAAAENKPDSASGSPDAPEQRPSDEPAE